MESSEMKSVELEVDTAEKAAQQKVISLDHHTDPFAPRAGKTLLWKNVNMTLEGQGDKPARKLLDDVWGEIPQKDTTAIMGPSGAGKTSLLNILAGRASSNGRISISSDVRLNNYTVDPTDINVRQLIAFVAQDDSLQVTSTPREAIRFSAKLRLSRATTDSQLEKLTEKMIAELGLTTCADTLVGGAMIKGISGGERKRTSVGVELVTRPALVFLDEPTSGLDSFSAVQLCQVLKKVANAGSSVLFTIHQPSSEIFNSFDRLILMNKGRVMYQGPVEEVSAYFGGRSKPVPMNYNPADWIMTVAQSVQISELDELGFYPKDERELGDAFEAEDGKDPLGITITGRPTGDGASKIVDSRSHGIFTQTQMLFAREFTNLVRDTTALGARFFLTTFLSVLIGVIFLNVGEEPRDNQTSTQSQFGALVMLALMSMFGTAQPALLAFPQERPVFLREYSTNHYSVFSYFISRLTMEAFITAVQIFVMVVITYFLVGFHGSFGIFVVTIYSLAMASTALAVTLGCAVEDPKLGQEMLPLLFVPQMLFAGFFVTPELIPPWLRWARYLCTLTYAVRILLVGEFQDCADNEAASGAQPTYCSTILENVEADEDETWWNWLVLVSLFAFFRLAALFILQRKATKFY